MVLIAFLLFQVEITIHEKYSSVVMIGRFFRVSFYTFSDPRDTTLRKRTSGVFFSMSFSNSLNMKKMSSFSFVELVKTSNNDGLVDHDGVEPLLLRVH